MSRHHWRSVLLWISRHRKHKRNKTPNTVVLQREDKRDPLSHNLCPQEREAHLSARCHCTSCKGFLHVVDDLVVVADDGVPVDEDRHLLPQVQPHEPRLLVLLQGQTHVPLIADQALLMDD